MRCGWCAALSFGVNTDIIAKGMQGHFAQPEETEATRPPETVATFEERELDSGYGMPSIRVREVWRKAGVDEQVRRLLREHREPVEHPGIHKSAWTDFLKDWR